MKNAKPHFRPPVYLLALLYRLTRREHTYSETYI